MRFPYAAQQLQIQVLAHKPRAKVLPHGEPDGLNVVRSFSVSKAAAKWLEPILTALDDKRIKSFTYDDDGRLIVTFVPTVAADSRDRFLIEEVLAVLEG